MNDGWQHMKVSEFAEVIGGGTPKTAVEQYWNGEIPWISPSDLTGYTKVYIKQGAKNISEFGLNSSSTKLLPENTVLLSSRAPIGYVAIAENPICTNQGFRSLICDTEKIIPLFLYYALKVYKPTLEAFATGATFPELSGSALKKISIPIPTIKEQERISKILISYDNLIENNTKRIAILEQMAEQIYKEWFVRMRFPGYENTKFVKGVPEEWEVVNYNYFGKEIRRNIKKEKLNPEDLYVGLEHLPVRSLILRKWDTTESVESDKLMFEKGEILFCKIRPYLHKVALAPFNGICSTDTIVIKPSSEMFKFYAAMISISNVFIDFAYLTSTGTKMPRADWKVLKRFNCFYPGDKLLKKFNNNVSVLFNEESLLNKQNAMLIKSRDLLLPRLISGKLSVEQASQKLQEVL